MTGTVRDIDSLSEGEQTAMQALLNDNFENVSTAAFRNDLHEKEKVVLLRDPDDRIQGFSTMLRYSMPIAGEEVVGIFSGDTIINPAFWGTMALPRTWARLAMQWSDAVPHDRVYWLLLSAGYKTYRFLPIFFDTFYPTHEKSMPPKQKGILDALATARYPQTYDRDDGVVRLDHPTPLRDDVAPPTDHRRQNPHISFFLDSNPDWTEGDELVCLAQIDRSNITRAARRII